MDENTRKYLQTEISKAMRKRKARDTRIMRDLKEGKPHKPKKFPLPRRTLIIPPDHVPEEFKEKVRKLLKEADDFCP